MTKIKSPVAHLTRAVIRDQRIVISVRFTKDELAIALEICTASGKSHNLFFYANNGYQAQRIPPEVQSTFHNHRGRTIAIQASYFLEPINSVVIKVLGPSGYELAETTEAEHFLSGLWPKTPQEFERMFFRNKDRCKDVPTLAFQLEQILAHYKGDRSHIVVSSVIYAYKALELGTEAEIRKAITFLEHANTLLLELPRTNAVRSDREHLRGSINIVLWHLYLYLGDADNFIATVKRGYIKYTEKHGLHTMCAFNLCRTVLAFGLICEAEGETAKAIQAYKEVVAWFRYSASTGRSLPYSVSFLELGDAHRAAYLACRLAEVHREKARRPSNREIFESLSRISNGPAKTKLAKSFSTIFRNMQAAQICATQAPAHGDQSSSISPKPSLPPHVGLHTQHTGTPGPNAPAPNHPTMWSQRAELAGTAGTS